ncbi:MAG: tryptophan synthase subunit alpha [Candidatus Dadabacteria bacterium]|nr:MAG: tryptophan synthase subunit alpha [Candidatus Dadabacteria bacterium]
MTDRVSQCFKKTNKLLSVFFVAGFPNCDDTPRIIEYLQEAGADLIEIGIPFSDPLADGPDIEQAASAALKNGMSLKLLFKQLEGIRAHVSIPLFLMGYINPIVQFGVENFCRHSKECGIDGVIIPDLPPEYFRDNYSDIFTDYNLKLPLLVTPLTELKRILEIDSLASGFLYAVTTPGVTGRKIGDQAATEYLKKLASLNLKNPLLAGFGVHDSSTFFSLSEYTRGCIIGSAYIRALRESNNLKATTLDFVSKIRG